jgi:hypothetical protein
MDEAEPQDSNETESTPPARRAAWKPLAWTAILAGLLLVGWLNYPSLLEIIVPTPTLLPQPTITQTVRPTHTPTITPSPTAEPTPTNTPLPVSAYYLTDGWQLSPPIRGIETGLIVLDEATSATVEPGFDTPFWVSSEQIATETGFDISEPYYATFGYGSITWETDVAVGPGLVEIYVMDTLYSSAGPLDFQVHLGSSERFPIIGSRQVEFLSVRGEPPQRANLWRSLGIYQLDRLDKLSISTAWERRDERTLVAVDRVVIVPLPDSTRHLLSGLPRDREIVIVDNRAADIESTQVLFQETGKLSWGDHYQYVINPSNDVRVIYTAPELLLPGQYQVAVWVPSEHANLETVYTLTVNENDILNDAGEQTVTIDQSTVLDGQWVDLGTWTTPRIYEKPVQLSLRMEIEGGSAGEAAFDAVAFIRLGEEAQESP